MNRHEPNRHTGEHIPAPASATAVLEMTGLSWASSKNVAEAVLSRRPGVLAVDANPVGQVATVTYDPTATDLTRLRAWVRECGFHCDGQSVPKHICDPMAEPAAAAGGSCPPLRRRPPGYRAGAHTRARPLRERRT